MNPNKQIRNQFLIFPLFICVCYPLSTFPFLFLFSSIVFLFPPSPLITLIFFFWGGEGETEKYTPLPPASSLYNYFPSLLPFPSTLPLLLPFPSFYPSHPSTLPILLHFPSFYPSPPSNLPLLLPFPSFYTSHPSNLPLLLHDYYPLFPYPATFYYSPL